jgi:predicted O-methyltransferase YrrM
MHCQKELELDLGYDGAMPDKLMLKWFNDAYSTSKHLLTLYSLAKSLGREHILEIGFGRSSFILAKAAIENKCKFTTCDNRDFSYLLNDSEKEITTYHCDLSDSLWEKIENDSLDFAFLDYFSGESLTVEFVQSELSKCIEKMKGNGVIAIHDVHDDRYIAGQAIEKLARSWKYKNKVNYSKISYNYGLGIVYIKEGHKKNVLNDILLKKADG